MRFFLFILGSLTKKFRPAKKPDLLETRFIKPNHENQIIEIEIHRFHEIRIYKTKKSLKSIPSTKPI